MQLQEQDYQFEDFSGYENEKQEPVHTLYILDHDPMAPRLSPQAKSTIQAFIAFILLTLAMIGLCLIPTVPVYSLQTLVLPAQVYTQELQAVVPLLATGKQEIPASRAYGYLTVYNGSFLAQSLPQGFLVTAPNGIEIATDKAIVVPGAHLPQPGIAVVSAHAVHTGSQGNIPAFAIQEQYGSDLTIKNLAAFHGGQDSVTKTYLTDQDKAKALDAARQHLTSEKPLKLEARPCIETIKQTKTSLSVSWLCQFVSYPIPRNGQIVSVHLSGKSVIVHIKIVVHSVVSYVVK